MRHWSLLAIRNWRARQVRTLGALLAIALGTAAVVWITCSYESVRRTISSFAADYLGKAHVTVTSPLGKYDQIPQRIVRQVRKLDNVKLVTPRLLMRVNAEPWPGKWIDRDDLRPKAWTPRVPEFDFQGIDLQTEFAVREYRVTAGHMLTEADERACVLEEGYARQAGVGVGDYLLVWLPAGPPAEVEIVGLLDRRRIAKFQKPLALMRLAPMQRMLNKYTLITEADVVLERADRDAVNTSARRIRAVAARIAGSASVRDAQGRMKQVEQAQEQQFFLLILLSCVAMLTALFIILSTLSMGMVERIGQLGLMRCVGVTRLQLAALVLLEVLPLGIIGIAIGIPLGMGFTALTVALVPEYVGSFAISWPGIALAATAGMITTLVAAVLPVVAAVRVSPLEAAHPRARQVRQWVLAAVGAAALAALLIQHFVLVENTHRSLEFAQFAAGAIVLLYVGYALIAPGAVRLVGAPAVWVAALVLRIRARLLQDQVGHAVWRSAGICCGLMVGLSLIVGLFVINASLTRGWQFPKEFPEAYLWSFDQLSPVAPKLIEGIEGVGDFTVANSINVIVEERPAFAEQLLRSVTWFLGCEPDSFMRLVKLDFIEGDEQAARELLQQGGHLIVTDDFARSRNKHLGDTIRVFNESRGTWEEFTCAGVVRSPSVDIAAGYFQLHSEYAVVASGSVMGSNEDLKRRFGVDGTRVVLLNFDLEPEPVPADWPPPRDSPEGRALGKIYYDDALPLERRWQRRREEKVLRELRDTVHAPQAYFGTVRELKDQIDRQLTETMQLLTAIPLFALVVAAVGVANLMTANVTARARQLAVLRAVGATRGLILRMVIGEAVVLGLLGSGLGVLLGLHLAYDITDLVARMWGFRAAVQLPWGVIGGAIGLTVGLCVAAGILPARRAARTNVVEALHVA